MAIASVVRNFRHLSQFVGDRQKSEPQNGGNKKTKHTEFSENQTFLMTWYPLIGALFSCYFCFEIRPFALSPANYFWSLRWYILWKKNERGLPFLLIAKYQFKKYKWCSGRIKNYGKIGLFMVIYEKQYANLCHYLTTLKYKLTKRKYWRNLTVIKCN